MNMDKKVLTTFGVMNDSFKEANTTAKATLDSNLETLKQNAADKPEKWKDKFAVASNITSKSDEFFNYLESVKADLKAGLDEEAKDDAEKQDSPDAVNVLFFKKDKPSEKGEEFLSKINTYRTEMEKLAPQSKANLEKRFSTAPDRNKEDTHDVPWLESRFEGFPLIAVLSNITKMQSDIRTSESEVIDGMVTGVLVDDASMNKYKAIVAFDKSAYYPGETLKGRIVLGRYDNSMVPTDVLINNKSFKSKVVDGQVVLDGTPVGSVGDRTLKGKFIYMEDGEKVEIPIDTKYSVIPKPNSPVISADKMNVVYRGVSNPITVSFPGIPDNKISASAPGMTRKSGTSYIMRPKGGKTVKISATGTLPSGVKVSGSKTFRIKDIPNPVGTIRRESGVVSMPKSSLMKSTVGAALQDFDFDLKLRVTGFSFRVPGKPTIKVSGSKLNGAAKSALSRAKAGQTVMIFNINAKIANNGTYRLKKVAPVTILLK
jgi:gliding motility-associated protein GldM